MRRALAAAVPGLAAAAKAAIAAPSPSPPSGSRPPAARIAAASDAAGSPRQSEKSTAATSPASRSRGATPACRSELLPTPLAPKSSVSREASTFATTSSASESRPKKSAASASS